MALRSKILRIIDVTTIGLRRLRSQILEYNGKTAVLTRARDATERKRMEEEIKSLARFPSENPNPLLRIDRNGILLTANEASKALLQKWSFGVGQVAPKFWCEVATEALSTGVSKNLDVEVDAKFYSFFVKPNMEAGYVNLYGRDITQRKQAEQALRESEQRFRAILDGVNDGILVADVENREFYLGNSAICRMVGYRPEDIKNLGVMDIHPKESLPYVTEQFDRLARHEIGVATEIPVKRRDGSVFYADISSSFLTLAGRTYLVGVFRDITERKRAETALRESEELYRHLIQRQGEGLAILDLEERFTFCNPRGDEIFGVSPGGMVGRTTQEFTTPQTFEFIRKQTEKRLAGEKATYELEIVRPDGDKRHLLVTAAPWLDVDGHVIGSVAIFRDETDRKRAEEEIRRLNQLRETIIDNANVWLDVLDENANVVIWNKAAEVISGYSREEVVGHGKIWEWLYPDEEYRKQLIDQVAEVIKRGRVEEDFETRIRRKDGQIRIISWNERNLLDEHGKPIGSIAIGRDVSERKRMQKELERYSKHLEELVRERTEELRESEEKYRSLVENIPDITWTTDRDGRTVFVSPNVVKVTGRTPEEIYAAGGTLWLERMHPDDIERVREAYEALFARNEPYDVEYRLQRKDGEWIWLHDRSVATYEKGGRRYADGLLSDITERKRMEEQVGEGMLKLSESEAKFRALYDSIADGIIYNDVPGRIFDCNRAFEKMVGYSLDELRKMKWQDITPKQYVELEESIVREDMLKRGFSTYVEKEYIRKDGSRIQVETTASVIRGTGGKPDMIWCIVRDITERKRAEQQVEEGMLKLRESEAKFRGLYESIRDGIMANDVSGRIYDCNKAFENMVGYSLDELRNMRYQDITPEQYRELEDRITREEMVREGFSGYVEKEYVRKDGTRVPVEVAASPVKGTGGKPDMIWGVIRDITERKRAEEELRSARERLEHVIASNPAVIITGKPRADLSDYDVTYLSDRVVEMLGFEPQQFIGHSEFWDSHVHPDDLRRYSMEVPELWKKGQCTFEYRFLHKNGTYRWIREEAKVIRDAAGNPVEVMGYWTDVTEQKRMEEALVKSQRFATIGEVAAMVGHDLRNPLQVLTNALYLLEEGFKTQASSKKVELLEKNRPVLLETMEEQIGYMNKIVSDLQDYARPLKPELAPTNLRRLIDEVLSAAGLPISIDVSIEVEENVRELNIDHGLMKRAFTNFVTNAVQAMPDGGRLTIRALKADGIALISIQDTGAGIPKENLDKVFTPMFSTKAKGQGFGLAACKRIVEAHNGKISLESAVGKGTTVFIKIPIVEVGQFGGTEKDPSCGR